MSNVDLLQARGGSNRIQCLGEIPSARRAEHRQDTCSQQVCDAVTASWDQRCAVAVILSENLAGGVVGRWVCRAHVLFSNAVFITNAGKHVWIQNPKVAFQCSPQPECQELVDADGILLECTSFKVWTIPVESITAIHQVASITQLLQCACTVVIVVSCAWRKLIASRYLKTC